MTRSLSPVLLLAASLVRAPVARAALSASEIFKKVSPSVVVVRSLEPGSGGRQGSQGSGVVVGPETVITNAHVVAYSTEVVVAHQGRSFPAKVMAISVDRDLCELRVPGLVAPAVTKVPMTGIEVGQAVFAIGAPKGFDLTLSQGLVSSIRRSGGYELIQTSAAISHGSSGGGLFDDQGRLSGVTTLTVSDGQNLNFAVPAEWIDQLSSQSLVTNEQEGQWFLEMAHGLRRKDFPALVQVAEQWLDARPNNGYVLAHLGDALVLQKQLIRAVEVYQRATQATDPASEAFILAAWKGLGDVFLKLHRYTSTIQAMERFIAGLEAKGDLNPQQRRLVGYGHEVVASALTSLGRYDEAVEHQEKVAEIVPDSIAPQINIARILRRKGDHPGALRWLDAAEKKTPGHPNVRLERGIIFLRTRKPDRAVQELEAACESKPWDPLGKPLLAEAYLELGRRANAERVLASVADELADDPAIFRRLGLLQLQSGEFAAAATTLERALAGSPRDPEGWWALGTASMQGKAYPEAIEAFANAALLAPEDAKAWVRLGVLRSKTRDYTGATEALERAIELQPGSGRLLYRLGLTYLAAKDQAGVRRTLKRLASVDRKRAKALKGKALASPLFRR